MSNGKPKRYLFHHNDRLPGDAHYIDQDWYIKAIEYTALLEQAEKLAGVLELLEVYEPVADFKKFKREIGRE
jgi:hypothetical protein